MGPCGSACSLLPLLFALLYLDPGRPLDVTMASTPTQRRIAVGFVWGMAPPARQSMRTLISQMATVRMRLLGPCQCVTDISHGGVIFHRLQSSCGASECTWSATLSYLCTMRLSGI